VMRRFGNTLLIVALLANTGGHWALLQSVAWTTMLVEHLHSQSFSQSMEQTFDGRHPCPLCLAIKAAKNTEKKTFLTLTTQKIEFPPLAPKFVLYSPASLEHLPTQDVFADSPTLVPPTPPPRTFPV